MNKVVIKNERVLYIILTYVSFSIIILFWEAIVYFGEISPLVLVKPSEIYPVIFENADILISELIFTFTEVIVGWIFGNLSGIAFSIIIYNFKKFANILISISIIINAVPLIALAAILGGIFGTNQGGKTIIVALLVFFPMFIASLKAFSFPDMNFAQLFDMYGATRFEKFVKLIWPSSLPVIFNTLKIGVVIAIFAAIVGEFFGAHGGIGDLILAKKGLYNLPMVWAAIFYIIIAGSLLYFLVSTVQKFIIRWRDY